MNFSSRAEFPAYVVDRRLRRRFKALLRRTGARAVLTSTWRVDPVGLYAAKHYGVPFIGVCPDRPKSPRRNEVLLWLKHHPRVTRYAVIDDEDDELDDLPLFETSSRSGLTPKIAKAVERYLKGQTEETMRTNAIKRLGENVVGLLHRDKS
jgi:hypothetical protein